MERKRKKLVKKIIQKYRIKLLTGLHIGGSKESVEIGALDNPVIRDPLSNEPYIPGSSIKGKMRSLLEVAAGIPNVGGGDAVKNIYKKMQEKKEITESEKKFYEKALIVNKVFGYADINLPSAVIFTDAFLTEESKRKLEAIRDRLDAEYTELKFENTINRITGKADHPRQTERVPRGAEFEFEIIINVWEYEEGGDNENEVKELLQKGIELLNNDYLGGSGSRGYGRVKITLCNEKPVPVSEIFGKDNQKSEEQ